MISAIVLAAGKSERMGKNKLLLEINGETMIEHVIKALQESKVEEIIAVVGFYAEELTKILKKYNVKVVFNKDYEKGMTSSFKKGVENLSRECEAFFLVLGDQPFIKKEIINKLIERYRERRALIVSPIYKGKKGHPVLFDKKLKKEILSLKEEEVVRDIIHRHVDDVLLVEAPMNVIMDIDTKEDYERIVKKLKK